LPRLCLGADLTPVVNEAEHVASVKSLGLGLSARTSAKTGDGVNQVGRRGNLPKESRLPP